MDSTPQGAESACSSSLVLEDHGWKKEVQSSGCVYLAVYIIFSPVVANDSAFLLLVSGLGPFLKSGKDDVIKPAKKEEAPKEEPETEPQSPLRRSSRVRTVPVHYARTFATVVGCVGDKLTCARYSSQGEAKGL